MLGETAGMPRRGAARATQMRPMASTPSRAAPTGARGFGVGNNVRRKQTAAIVSSSARSSARERVSVSNMLAAYASNDASGDVGVQ
jgi:hypothetical protein